MPSVQTARQLSELWADSETRETTSNTVALFRNPCRMKKALVSIRGNKKQLCNKKDVDLL